uniref:Uncharacterized protein n=1 Tax=Avena sativa TaxID=4498 RepID=A0ACD5Y8A8_AVESA
MVSHLRSTSVPSSPRSSEINVEEELQSLKASTSSTIKMVCDGSRRLLDIYGCIDKLASFPSNHVLLCKPHKITAVEQDLERSLALLEIYEATQVILSQLRATIQDMMLTIKRGDDVALQAKIMSWFSMSQKSQKKLKKVVKKFSSANQESFGVIKLFPEAREATVKMIESLSVLLSKQIAMPNSGKWSIVSKAFQNTSVACEEQQLHVLELDIADESGVETLFRRLI